MNNLLIEATEDTPKVELDLTNNVFRISERSLPENSIEFYQPILNWIEEYSKHPNLKTIFEFRLEYFNTSSAKQIAKILLLLEKLSHDSEVLIKWFYNKDDRDIHSSGTRYSKLINVKFELIEE
ncbi:MAG TPA: nuclear pore complex subunit [Bacteroidales bacterium]|nr:MAG: hypothetical protein A2W98_06660 [Bacteroidetes bacterium GWF2_33_38]OFY75032.1 MAG: hypothetical protein A2265_12075 [Bacteroidetes bacterium RIFOXYA12_FULL_33_9]OFY88061.1 MAG: hypothetical protein A2236_00245 [Bacteroidetes bacterium RIFOXYA2_FULL_33_7]HBF87203.1 nuclear pore complex subunit [Bacteroidales bacterium]